MKALAPSGEKRTRGRQSVGRAEAVMRRHSRFRPGQAPENPGDAADLSIKGVSGAGA